MGAFDVISIEIKCPECGSKPIIQEQIKWTNNRSCHTYNLGDKIDVEDGEYNRAIKVRQDLVIMCNMCGHEFLCYNCERW